MEWKVGDTVWNASFGRREVWSPCPVCFGKREVTLILGNDDHVCLPCEYCSRGFNPPTGDVCEYEFVAEAVPVVITQVQITEGSGGTKREYRGGHFIYYEENLFPSSEAAMARAQERAAEYAEEEKTRAEYLKEKAHKSFSWNAGYHMREAKRCQEAAARHLEKAALCKARARGGE